MAWETFREANGVRSLSEMRQRVGKYRDEPIGPGDNPTVGCIMLGEPFFWNDPSLWIPSPPDFKLNTVSGKTYDSESGTGRQLWDSVSERLKDSPPTRLEPDTAMAVAIASQGFGTPQIILPRLGQGLFRVLVTEVYSRRCGYHGRADASRSRRRPHQALFSGHVS
jgi:putative restriction endonuclease